MANIAGELLHQPGTRNWAQPSSFEGDYDIVAIFAMIANSLRMPCSNETLAGA